MFFTKIKPIIISPFNNFRQSPKPPNFNFNNYSNLNNISNFKINKNLVNLKTELRNSFVKNKTILNHSRISSSNSFSLYLKNENSTYINLNIEKDESRYYNYKTEIIENNEEIGKNLKEENESDSEKEYYSLKKENESKFLYKDEDSFFDQIEKEEEEEE